MPLWIPDRVEPVVSNTIQPDGMHQAATDLAMSRMTTAMHHQCMRYTTTKAFASSELAPRADVTAAQSWSSFTIGHESTSDLQCTYELPWQLSEAANRIACRVKLAWQWDAFLAFRLNASTLIDSVTTTNGTPSRYLGVNSTENTESSGRRFAGRWSTLPRYRAGGDTVEIDAVAVPASRRIVLTPQVKIPEAYNLGITLTGTMRVYIISLQLYEVFD